jgi:succinate dehydrogenase / fumarate reductase, cytochrome b subunit
MGWLTRSLSSSIGKKFLMALTGSFLIIFLVVHLIGNLQLYVGRDAFNTYVEALDMIKPIIRVIEILLGLGFFIHMLYGIKLWLENKKARPTKYAVKAGSQNSDVFSRTTFVTGSIIGIFLVFHLKDFWYPFNFVPSEVTHYDLVVSWFQIPVYSIFYVLAVLLLGYHLNHGFQSAFQTFGWNSSKYFPLVKTVGFIYALIMTIGFGSIPIYFLLGGN